MTNIPDEAAQAYGYLSRLFAVVAPRCTPLPTLMGLCTQIDNYIAALRPPAGVDDTEVETLLNALGFAKEPFVVKAAGLIRQYIRSHHTTVTAAGVDTVEHTDAPQQVTGFIEVSDYVKNLETDAEARGYARAKAGDAVTVDELADILEEETWADVAAKLILSKFNVTRKAAG